MATYLNVIENLTSLELTDMTLPSTEDVTHFLRDGQRRIVSRLKVLDPASLIHLSRTVKYTGDGLGEDNGDGSFDVPSGIVLQVEREDTRNGDYRAAHPIESARRADAERPGSIHFVSRFNPGYYILNNQLHVIPHPKIPGEVNDCEVKLTYVPYDDDIVFGNPYNTLTHSNKPQHWNNKYRDLLVHYAAIRCLRSRLTDMTLRDQDPELVPILVQTMEELKSYYDGGFISMRSMQQQQEPQQQRGRGR